MDAAASGSLTVDEFMSALYGLTEPEWTRVGEAARWCGLLCSTDGDELLNEAIMRTADGRRHYPNDVQPVAFLIMTMRSIAHEMYENRRGRIGLDNATTTNIRGNVVPFQPTDQRPDPEISLAQAEFEKKFRSDVLGLFEDDTIARDLADGVMEGMEGEELMTVLDLDKTAFASKRRLVRRRIEQAFPDGYKP
ncbi:sigma-24 (FecI-like) [Nitrobacter hamburgensis X14]|uniref:Sigma-24 (FecI-like) n=1 Tax=Nitrobacter hamburgensis (strain DSM 10229 / NCIMB 13809 / X14) TaxID=323097 RepID=Q1QNK2_NITHX|nr:hypothetical protein [Nitrobacter hamburgensis]ABE62195.1 sigma-24 (FecI-like) [Nitrobacter hamburgensis X14]